MVEGEENVQVSMFEKTFYFRQYLRPGDHSGIEARHAPVTAALLTPSRYSQSRDLFRHTYHLYDDPAHLPHCCFRNAVLDRL